jgi:hypothetical protein
MKKERAAHFANEEEYSRNYRTRGRFDAMIAIETYNLQRIIKNVENYMGNRVPNLTPI